MRFKVFILTLFLTVLAVAAPQARRAAKLEHIRFGKCRIISMTPKGLRSVRAEVELEAKNDTAAFVLEDVKLLISGRESRSWKVSAVRSNGPERFVRRCMLRAISSFATT
jgi:hypothetical protein